MSELRYLKKIVRHRQHLVDTQLSQKNPLAVSRALSKFKTWLAAYGHKNADKGARAMMQLYPDMVLTLLPGKESRAYNKFIHELKSILNEKQVENIDAV